MYELKKTFEINAAHQLNLDYESKCTQLHGHNWFVTVYLRSQGLNPSGMIMDFSEIKQRILGKLDHRNLNDVLDFPPTAENLARYICDELAPFCYRADVRESEGNTASYIKTGEGFCPFCGCGV